MNPINKVLICSTLLLTTLPLCAEPVVNTEVQNTVTKNSETRTIDAEKAKSWNLTETEWNRYQALKKGPRGQYYDRLSPPEVLGLNADSEEDVQYYAEIAAKQAHDKLERELRFNKAFHDAAVKLYGNEQIIKSFDLRPYTPIPKVSYGK